MSFDLDSALEQFRDGLPEPGRTSTQSWGIETWSKGWRDDEDRLDPAALSPDEAAFWYRALTEPARLGDDRQAARSMAALSELSGPLTGEEAVRRLRDFVTAADQELTHWPRSALAPAAFALRCALEDLSSVRTIIERAVSPASRARWVRWLGPLEPEFAEAWIAETKRPDVIEALAASAGRWNLAVERLTELGARDRADRFSDRMDPEARVAWTLENRRPVDVQLLEDAVGVVDDETWIRLCRKVLSRRDREVWQVLSRRPLAALVPRVLEKLSGPLAGWILDWFAMGDSGVLDALIEQALGRAKRRESALRVLAELNDDDVRRRIDELDEASREKLRERLGPITEELPELPRRQRIGWMDTFAARKPRPDDWLTSRYVPSLETQSGYRLPATVEQGLIATIQEARLAAARDGRPADRYDAALTSVADELTEESVTRWWNALFGQWWSADRPADGAWVLTAAAFVAPPGVIRDLGTSMHHYRMWFGDHAADVLHALRVRGTPWAIAVLDDTARRGRSEELREMARTFLTEAATQAGLTVDAFVEEHLPASIDEALLRLIAERFEDSMVEGRTWSGWSWTRRLENPPFAEVASTVLWALTDHDGHVTATFRYDGVGPVGPQDEVFEVGDDERVVVAHPAGMNGDELARWNQVFVDYELVQPFEQIARERYRHASLSADGFRSPIGRSLSARTLRSAAVDHGWEDVQRGAHGDVVGFRRVFRRWDVVAQLHLSDPISKRRRAQTRIDRLTFSTGAGDELDPAFVPDVPFSEVHRDLLRIVE